MQCCEGRLLGRAPVAATSAQALASLVRSLRGAPAARRYLLRCRDILQLLPHDEGFESDAESDDTVSNASSSCYFVDDHVFRATQPASASSVATDSANSSGASDTDDVDTSLTSLSVYQRNPAPATEDHAESYGMNDIVFCHTDPAFPKVVVWVVKKHRPSAVNGVLGDKQTSGLEAIVFECSSEKGLKRLCTHFQEVSRRYKLEQYRHPHRRKDLAPALPPAAASPTASTLPTKLTKPSPYAPVTSSPKSTVRVTDEDLSKAFAKMRASSNKEAEAVPATTTNVKFNLVQRTDGDGVTHIEVSRGPHETSSMDAIDQLSDFGGPSSIISISTPDAGNISSGSSHGPKTRFTKEIESVIRTDIDTSSVSRKENASRQRHPAILVTNPVVNNNPDELRKVWSPPPEQGYRGEEPPQRPERKKNSKKSKQPAPPPPVKHLAEVKRPNTPRHLDAHSPMRASPVPSNQQKIVRGQYIRVAVEQQVPSKSAGSWKYGNKVPSWGMAFTRDSNRPTHRRPADDVFRHSRSRSKSPPAVRTPMAYRYIDVGPSSLSNRFFGLSQKLREAVVGTSSPYGTTSRRRSTDMYHSADNLLSVGHPHQSNLKSVIKKNKRNGDAEPKKVTFSAYATVQVVD